MSQRGKLPPGHTTEPPGGFAGCAAPEAALYFRPDGLVMACCSGWHVLGSVVGPDRMSLHEIWGSPNAEALREALGRGDYSLGCFECEQLAEAGRRSESLAWHFDRYPIESHGFPEVMDFALSDRCNLQCIQCSGTYSSAIRREREGRAPLAPAYDDRFFSELDEFLPFLRRAQFKGGEPFLSSLNHRVWDRLLEFSNLPEVSITTNGTVWGPRVQYYTEALRADVLLSVDAADDDELRRIRVGVNPPLLWRNIRRFRETTLRTGSSMELSFCLMSMNWEQLARLLRRADGEGVQVGVIWVEGPGSVRLLSLPRTELVDVLRVMERQSRELVDLDSRLGEVWTATLERIRAAVESPADAGGTRVLLRRADRSLIERDDEVRRQEVDEDEFRLEYYNEVLVSVQVPKWAEWMGSDQWLGIGLRDTMMVMATRVGGSLHSKVRSIEGGGHSVNLAFERHGRLIRLGGRYSGDSEDPARSRIVLTLMDNSGLPHRGTRR